MSAMSSTGLLHLEDSYGDTNLGNEDVARFNRSILRLAMVFGIMLSITIVILLIINAPATIPVFAVVGAALNAYYKMRKNASNHS